MTEPKAPRRIQHALTILRISAETLLYDDRRHKAFCLNQSASVIWRLADGERSVPQICTAAAQELSMPVSEALVLLALDQLERDELLEPTEAPSVQSAMSRRDVLQRLTVGSAMLLPVIAAIVAPTAAQAYSGCVDCSSVPASQAARARRLQQADQTTYDVFGNPVQPSSSYPQRRARRASDATGDGQP